MKYDVMRNFSSSHTPGHVALPLSLSTIGKTLQSLTCNYMCAKVYFQN